MEQLLHLEALKRTELANVTVVAISPESVDATRVAVLRLETSKRTCLTHRFLSDPELDVVEAYGARNERGSAIVRPVAVLLDGKGREVWRFTERMARMVPEDQDLAEAVRRLKAPREGDRLPRKTPGP